MDAAELFFEIDGPRREGKGFHQLSGTLMIVVYSYLADCEGFEEVHDYICNKQEVLREVLGLPCGIPSHDTLSRVFRRLDPAQLEALLTDWERIRWACWPKNNSSLMASANLTFDAINLLAGGKVDGFSVRHQSGRYDHDFALQAPESGW